MAVIALLSVVLVRSVIPVSVVLVVNCIYIDALYGISVKPFESAKASEKNVEFGFRRTKAIVFVSRHSVRSQSTFLFAVHLPSAIPYWAC